MNTQTYFNRVQSLTPTKFWINNVTQNEADLAISHGALGCTQNPSYTWKMLTNENERTGALALLDGILRSERDDRAALSALQLALIERIAEKFMPLYEQSHGRFGYVTIQEDPFQENYDFIMARALQNRKNYPNMMVKVPVTKDGLRAIGDLAAQNIPINATEVMALQQAIDVCEVFYERTAGMKNPPVSVFSHIAGIFDEHLSSTVQTEGIDISSDILWHAGIAVAKKIYQLTHAKWPLLSFVSGGARHPYHFTEMVGADCIVTINWRGTADTLIEQNPIVVDRFSQQIPFAIVDELSQKLPDFYKAYTPNALHVEEYDDYGPVVRFRTAFENAWSSALEIVAQRRKEIGA